MKDATQPLDLESFLETIPDVELHRDGLDGCDRLPGPRTVMAISRQLLTHVPWVTIKR